MPYSTDRFFAVFSAHFLSQYTPTILLMPRGILLYNPIRILSESTLLESCLPTSTGMGRSPPKKSTGLPSEKPVFFTENLSWENRPIHPELFPENFPQKYEQENHQPNQAGRTIQSAIPDGSIVPSTTSISSSRVTLHLPNRSGIPYWTGSIPLGFG